MLEDIVETGIWRQIKQIKIEYHFFISHSNYFFRHAQAINNFLKETNFVQVKHDVNNENPKIFIGKDFAKQFPALAISHYINKDFLNKK